MLGAHGLVDSFVSSILPTVNEQHTRSFEFASDCRVSRKSRLMLNKGVVNLLAKHRL